ncbi:molybdopterin synthase catalytic subunit-like [Mercurialis annua]|uniref:molybdopterin synthase catalytic subunit-like n=1 Tax=Mercurialis annua TaxID=3986 RepID=UPI0021600DA0|nr:molybdopterin synthase catalytic subunit-like [Mercurialis annua]
MSNEEKTLVEISEENNAIDLANDNKTLVEILEENNPIDPAKYISYVSAPQAGGIATFSGTTRDTFKVNEGHSGIRVKVSEAGRRISSTHDGIRMSGGSRKTSTRSGGITIKVSEVS